MKRLHEKASITVFLSLLLVLFIGFIMMMTEHARIFGLRQRLVCATDSAMDSLFSYPKSGSLRVKKCKPGRKI